MVNPILSDRTDWSRSFFNLQLSAGHLPFGTQFLNDGQLATLEREWQAERDRRLEKEKIKHDRLLALIAEADQRGGLCKVDSADARSAESNVGRGRENGVLSSF